MADINNGDEVILVVDDILPNLKVLQKYLQVFGFASIAARNGKDALGLIEKTTDKKIIAIFSDLMMPIIDGVELLRIMKKHEQYKSIPFWVVTAVDHDIAFLEKLKAEGLNGYVTKPLSLQKVGEALNEIFPGKVKDIKALTENDEEG